jgi:hypothetical protein
MLYLCHLFSLPSLFSLISSLKPSYPANRGQLDIQIPTPQIGEVPADEASERRPLTADDKAAGQSHA